MIPMMNVETGPIKSKLFLSFDAPTNKPVKLESLVAKVKQFQQILDFFSSIKTQDSLLSKHVIALDNQIQEELNYSEEESLCSFCHQIKRFIASLFPPRQKPELFFACDICSMEITKPDLYQKLIFCKITSKALEVLKEQEHTLNTEAGRELIGFLFQEAHEQIPLWVELCILFSEVDEKLFQTITGSENRQHSFFEAYHKGNSKVFQKYHFPSLVAEYDEKLQKIYNKMLDSDENADALVSPYQPQEFFDHAKKLDQETQIRLFNEASLSNCVERHDLPLFFKMLAKADSPLESNLLESPSFMEKVIESDTQETMLLLRHRITQADADEPCISEITGEIFTADSDKKAL